MALPQSYRELTSEVATQMRALRKTQPDLMSAFAALAAAGTKEGALGKKTRELVALGIAIASRCDDCIGFHVQTLVKLETTREEFEDLLATAVYMGGGPSMMYAAHALRAVEEFEGSDGGWPKADAHDYLLANSQGPAIPRSSKHVKQKYGVPPRGPRKLRWSPWNASRAPFHLFGKTTSRSKKRHCGSLGLVMSVFHAADVAKATVSMHQP